MEYQVTGKEQNKHCRDDGERDEKAEIEENPGKFEFPFWNSHQEEIFSEFQLLLGQNLFEEVRWKHDETAAESENSDDKKGEIETARKVFAWSFRPTFFWI